MKILYTGSGSAGPVIPLLAVHEELKNTQDYQAFWMGDTLGPAQQLADMYQIPFIRVYAFKFHRFFTWRLFREAFLALWSLPKIIYFFLDQKPDIVLSAGAYVSVIPVYVAKLFSVPVLIHQQDWLPGLANRVMAPCANTVTVALDKHRQDFSKNTVVVLGNPVRKEIQDILFDNNSKQVLEKLGIDLQKPYILIMGGGQGSDIINGLIHQSLDKLLTITQVVHLCGKGKKSDIQRRGYFSYEFLYDEIPALIKHADLVISRAGMSSITELSYLSKASIFIPILHIHQLKNTEIVKDASLILLENTLNEDILYKTILDLLHDDKTRKQLEKAIHEVLDHRAAKRIAEEVIKLI